MTISDCKLLAFRLWYTSFTNIQSKQLAAFPSSKIFDNIESALNGDEALKKKLIKQTGAIIVFNLKSREGKIESWNLDLKKNGTIAKGASSSAGPADITLNIADSDFSALVDGKANAQRLFMSGKLKVKGNVMKAASVETVLKAAQQKSKAKL